MEQAFRPRGGLVYARRAGFIIKQEWPHRVFLDWTPQQHELFAGLRTFAAEHLTGERPAGLDRDRFEQCRTAGLLSLPLPTSWGGFGAGALETVGALEALGEGGADRGLLFGLGAHLLGCALPLARFGSEAQKQTWAIALTSGSALGALAVTEAEGGSSLSHLATSLEPEGDGWRLRGEKTCVTHAADADLMLVLAMQTPQYGSLGTTMVIVPGNTPGVEVEVLEPTLGLQGAPIGRVHLDCHLGADALLGGPHGGFKVFNTAIAWERACLLGGLVGAARRDLARVIDYLRTRTARGTTLLAMPTIGARLVRLQLRLEDARWAMYRACFALDQGSTDGKACAAAKVTVSETLVACAEETLTLLGGAGWCDELGVATALRDVLGTLSASGSNDALVDMLARSL